MPSPNPAESHVVVIGAGVAGLVAALECAKVGLAVTVVEASDRPGGTVRSVEVAGLTLDAAVEGWRAGGGAVRALADELGLGARIVPAADGEVWIAGLPGGAVPLPRRSIAGIPENPWDESVRRIIGWRGTWRAYLDRVRPPLTIGKERSLGRLVRLRMGDAVLERMVAPVSLGAYGIHPDDVDVEAAAPGLSTALTRTGSLSGGVAQLFHETAGSGVEGLEGGTTALVDALCARLTELGAVVQTGRRATRIAADADGHWSVAFAAVDGDADPDAASPAGPSADGSPAMVAAAVIVAVPEPEARRLLAPVAATLAAPGDPGALAASDQTPEPVEVITLVVHEPALDAQRRRAVYPVPGARSAVSVTDSTVRWPWLAAAASELHVLRVGFGAAGAAAATSSLDDAAAFGLALVEASALLDVPLGDLRGAARERFTPPQPASALGHAARAAAARGAVQAVPGLGATGAWISGSGLAHVVADAREEADRVRRGVLWGQPGA